jgi:glycerol-1-phosphate dehydrogenase [NAD(P)+]
MTLAQLNDLLSNTCGTVHIWLGERVLPELARFTATLPDAATRRCLVVADSITWKVAGNGVYEHLSKAGYALSSHLIDASPDRSTVKPVCDDEEVNRTAQQLRTVDASLVIAVGAGSVNDVAKLAAFQSDRPYLVIPTAPSMNGYTSSTAAVMSSGIKESIPCRGPIACLADLDILRQAPERMIAAGLGDLVSRSVSVADWYLSHRLLGTEYSPKAIALVEESARLCDGQEHELPGCERIAVARLMSALLISGEAMTRAGSSAPASGAEHLISHYLDMTRSLTDAGDLHGCQVGVATITTAAFYEQLLVLRLDRELDTSGLTASHRSWAEVQEDLHEHFGGLATALLPQAKRKRLSPSQLADRLTHLQSRWRSIQTGLIPLLRPSGKVHEQLLAAGAPVSFGALGVGPARARAAMRFGRHIRARYTILDLLSEVGLLDGWIDALNVQ